MGKRGAIRLLVLSVAGISLFAAGGWFRWRTHHGGINDEEARLDVNEDLGNIYLAIEEYAQKGNNGLIPAFSSSNLPDWWWKYGGQPLVEGIQYDVPPEVVGKRLSTTRCRFLVVARGPKAQRLFPRRKLMGIGYNIFVIPKSLEVVENVQP